MLYNKRVKPCLNVKRRMKNGETVRDAGYHSPKGAGSTTMRNENRKNRRAQEGGVLRNTV